MPVRTRDDGSGEPTDGVPCSSNWGVVPADKSLQFPPEFDDTSYFPKFAPLPVGLVLGCELTHFVLSANVSLLPSVEVEPTSQYVWLPASVKGEPALNV